MSKPDWCPQDVWDALEGILHQTYFTNQTEEEHQFDCVVIARAILAAEKRGEEREREACLQSVLNEQLSGESDDEGDRAYMRAIYDSASAIRARSKP